MGNENEPLNGNANAPKPPDEPRVKSAMVQFTREHLLEGRPFADRICEGAVGLSAPAAVAGAALGFVMLARVAEATPYQAWKLFDMWMRMLVGNDAGKPMPAPRGSLLAGNRTMVDELEDRLRHLIVSCMHGFDLNTDECRVAIRGLADAELDRLQRARAIATPAAGPQ